MFKYTTISYLFNTSSRFFIIKCYQIVDWTLHPKFLIHVGLLEVLGMWVERYRINRKMNGIKCTPLVVLLKNSYPQNVM